VGRIVTAGSGLSPEERSLRQSVLDVLLEAGRLRINQGTSGNASARWADGMVITPSAVPYEQLTPEGLVHVAADGTVTGTRPPSSEWRFHAGILGARPEVGAVVHLHSPAATALACLRREVPPFHYMVAVAGASSIRCAPYHTFGTPELADAAVAALEGRRACLLANHGLLALGDTPVDALHLAIEVEALCDQYLRACAVGEPVLLSQAEMDEVLGRFERYRAGTLD
jgi:L-fuculose-phosphate aldolase